MWTYDPMRCEYRLDGSGVAISLADVQSSPRPFAGRDIPLSGAQVCALYVAHDRRLRQSAPAPNDAPAEPSGPAEAARLPRAVARFRAK